MFKKVGVFMLKVLHCEQCGKTGLKPIHVAVELSSSKTCEHCYQSRETKECLIFCSTKCFLEFMKTPGKFAAKLAEFKKRIKE